MQNPDNPATVAQPRFSVVIPTYQRRDVVVRSVWSLTRQEYDADFEVIVVVDGSQDGSAAALRKLRTPFPFTVLEQPNRGAATARNRGASVARGDILMFLDDDMVSHPRLLSEHDGSHRQGVDAVIGHIPLHPCAPTSILTPGVKAWAEQRAQRLSVPGASLTLHDLLTGQLSITREVFDHVGGFDTNFTFGGSFGNEDVDFGYRLLLGGYRVVFNPNAISWQYYVVQPRHYLRQWHQAGYADVIFARKHPEQSAALFALNGSGLWVNRYVWRHVMSWPILGDLIAGALRPCALALVEHNLGGHLATRLYRQVKKAAYWRGVAKAGGIPEPRSLRVLAYHAIADLSGDPLLEPYGVPPNIFRRQLEMLLRAGFHFVDGGEVVRFLQGRAGLPRRAVLLTFDDCYCELLDVVLPILNEFHIPAVAFAVSACVGDTNQWDTALGARPLKLLDADGLKQLAAAGIEIGAHSRTHRSLKSVAGTELSQEIAGSVADLEALGLKRPQLFAYPYGEYDARAQRAAQDAGLKAAFTVDPGLVPPGHDPYQVPRIEMLRSDTGWKFWRKIAMPGRPPVAPRGLDTVLEGAGG